MVSCCSTCNSKKNASTKGFVHPYFENFNQYDFVKCSVSIVNLNNVNVINVDFSFSMFGKSNYDIRLSQRLKTLFDNLELSKRYSDYCVELINESLLEWKEDCKLGKDFFLRELNKVLLSRKKQYSNNSFIITFYKEFIKNIESGTITMNEISSIQ